MSNSGYITFCDENWYEAGEDVTLTQKAWETYNKEDTIYLDGKSFEEFAEACQGPANPSKELLEAKAKYLAKLKNGEITHGEGGQMAGRNIVNVGEVFVALLDAPDNILSANWEEGDHLEVVSTSLAKNEVEVFVDTCDKTPNYNTFITYAEFVLFRMGEYLQAVEEYNHDSVEGCFRMSAEDLKELCLAGVQVISEDRPDSSEFYLWDPVHKSLTKTD